MALRIYDKISSLAEFPRIGRIGKDRSTRELVIPSLPYIVIYQVMDDALEVMRIMHGAQRWP